MNSIALPVGKPTSWVRRDGLHVFVLCALSCLFLLPATAAPENRSSGAGAQSSRNEQAAERIKAEEESVDDDWKTFLEQSKKSYAEGNLSESSKQIESALIAAENLREGTRSDAFLRVGEQFLYLKQYEKAKNLLEEAIRLRRNVPGFRSIASANALDTLAQAYARTGNLDKAKKSEEEALATYEALKKVDTADYSIALSNHANTLRNMHSYKESEEFFARAVAAQQKIDKHAGSGDSVELAKILLNAGGLYCENDKLVSAKRLLDRASKIVRAKLSPEHPLYKLTVKSERVLYKKKVDQLLKNDANPYREELGEAVTRLGELYEEEGDPSQAAAAFKQAIAIREKLSSPDSPELKKVQNRYADSLKKMSEN